MCRVLVNLCKFKNSSSQNVNSCLRIQLWLQNVRMKEREGGLLSGIFSASHLCFQDRPRSWSGRREIWNYRNLVLSLLGLNKCWGRPLCEKSYPLTEGLRERLPAPLASISIISRIAVLHQQLLLLGIMTVFILHTFKPLWSHLQSAFCNALRFILTILFPAWSPKTQVFNFSAN